MAKLVVFGDSFANNEEVDYQWTKQLASKLQIDLDNNALIGSGINYSILKYFEYIETSYNPDDVIVFVICIPNRSPIVHPDYPQDLAFIPEMLMSFNSSGPTTHVYDNTRIDSSPRVEEHIKKYIGFYHIWQQHYNDRLSLAHINILRDSVGRLPNKKIIVSVTENTTPNNFATKCDCHVDGYLFKISCNEIKDGIIVMPDTRCNHLSPANHTIFSNYLHQCLTKEYKPINYEEFERGFLDA